MPTNKKNGYEKEEKEMKKVLEEGFATVVDKDVEEAINDLARSYDSVIRQQRMLNNQENKEIVESIHDTLPSEKSPRRIKDTKLMQILRLLSEDMYKNPPVAALSEEGQPELISQTVDSVVSRLKLLGRFDKAYRNAINDAVQREGSSFIMISPDRIIDNVTKKQYENLCYKNIDSSNVFADPAARCIEDGAFVGIRFEGYTEEVKKILKRVYKFEGEFDEGDALSIHDPETSGDNDDDLLPERTAIYDYYNVIEEERIVFVGQNKVLVLKAEKEKYPCRDEYGRACLPVVQVDATAFKYGIYAASWIDVSKDILEQKKRQFNQILPYFDRVSNQLLAVTGVTPLEDIASQISEAEAYQEQGMVPLLTLSDPQARIVPVFPSDISAPLERIRNIFTDELSDRLGLDLRISEKPEAGGQQTATLTMQLAKVHTKAISNIININTPFFNSISQLTLNYARNVWSDKDKRIVKVKEGSKNEYVLSISDAIEATREWKGRFVVDTSIDLDLTRAEKLSLFMELKKQFAEEMQLPFTTPEQVKPFKDLTMQWIKIVGLDKVIQDGEVSAFYDSIVEKMQKQQELDQQMQQQQMEMEKQAQQTQQMSSMTPPKGATSETPATQVAAANAGALAPQPNAGVV